MSHSRVSTRNHDWQKVGGGASSRIRTGDLMITNQLLYQLSYAGASLHLVRKREFWQGTFAFHEVKTANTRKILYQWRH